MNMINTNITRYLKSSLWVCLYLILITPLLIGDKFLFPFISLKTFYFRLLVEVALFFYVLLAFSDSAYRPKLNKLIILVFVFGLIVFLTGLLGVNPYRSFWGTIERGEGFLTISHIIIFFFLLSHAFQSRSQWLNYFSASVSISFLVGLYALAQNFTHLSWIIGAGEGRLSSTLGNAAYLGAYSLGHLWLCVLLFFERKKIYWRIPFALLGIFEFYILWQSETRGAFIGLAVALVVFLISGGIFAKSKKIKIIAFSLLILLFFSGLFIWSSRHSAWIAKSNTLNRLATISLEDITTQSRLYAWDSSWQGWKERFLVGYGWENYNIAFNKYFHPEIFRDNGSQIWFDRAHNTLFDVAVASGLGGLIVYLSIFGCALFYLFRYLRRDKDNLVLYLVAISFLIAHFIQNFFVFDCLGTYIMLFMVLGFVAFIVNKHEKNSQPTVREAIKPFNYLICCLGLIILILAGFFFNLQPAKANITGLDGLKYFYAGDIEKALDRMLAATKMGTYQSPEIRQKLADNVISLNKSTYSQDIDKLKQVFLTTVESTKANIAASPRDVQNYLYLMILYNSYSQLDASLPSQVLRLSAETLALSPSRPQIYFELGQAAINSGSPKQGLDYFEKAVALNPKNLDSQWLLLTAYIITGEEKLATSQYRLMQKMGLPENAQSFERLANLYTVIKNYKQAAYFYQKLINLDPQKMDYWSKLITVLKENGDQNFSDQTLSELFKTYPAASASLSSVLNKK
jgi:O-antigen ligase